MHEQKRTAQRDVTGGHMRWRRRLLAASLAAGVTCAVLLGTGGSRAHSEPAGTKGKTIYTLGNFVQPSVVNVAGDLGYLGKKNVRLLPQESGLQAIQLIEAGHLFGQADIAMTPIVVATTRHIPLKIVYATGLLALDTVIKSTIQLPDGLKGKTIAEPVGSINYFEFVLWLTKIGLKLSDVKVVDLGDPTGFAAAFASGQVDGLSWAPPITTSAIQNGGKLVDHVLTPAMLVVSPNFIKNHRSTVQATVCAIAKAAQVFRSRPAVAYGAMAKELHLSLAQVQQVFPTSEVAPVNQLKSGPLQLGGSSIVQKMIQVSQAMTDLNFGGVTQPLTAAQITPLFDTSFAKAVNAGVCPK